MICFRLVCDREHDFEAWFGSNDDFQKQKSAELIACPFCDSKKIEKALMSPALVGKGKKSEKPKKSKQPKKSAALASSGGQSELAEKLRELRRDIMENAEDAGDGFADEARKIHYGESEPRNIYGQANSEEVEELLEEGVNVFPLPNLPEDAN